MTVIADIGDNMRAIRKHLGVTQERLAELSGLSVNFISRLERTSDQNVSLKSLKRIAAALQIPITQLLENTDFNNNEPSEVQTNFSKVDQLCFELKSKDPKTAIELTDSFLKILKYTK
ncbi:helix-turn-helix domain-containing protein [Limosilactobacillus albertensis]|nr:helix-turn-helix transcriptional regulator [Limosilactobacillus albertensis]MCD7117317.1 helix-turn-helix domain-containing protein [Limosilactobacillus albertensis]MCD7128921.1 helix-turn-helix domain-containing protein [Limosilactobacillus albertensis]